MFDNKNTEKPKTLKDLVGEKYSATTPQTTPLPTQPLNINSINTNSPRETITTNSSKAYSVPKPTAPQAAPTSTKKSFRFANKAQQEKFFQDMDPNTLYAISNEELKRNIKNPFLVLNQIYTQFGNVDEKLEEFIIKYKLEGLYNQVVSPQSVSKSISTSDKKLFPFANDEQVWLFFRDMQQTTIEEIAFNDYKQNISDGASLLTLIKKQESDFLGKVSELIINYKLEGWYTQVTSPQPPKKLPFQIASNVKLFNNETQECRFFQEIGQEKVGEIAWNELMKKISSGLTLARTIHTQSSEFDNVVYNIIIKYNLIKSYQDMFPNSRVTFPGEPARATTPTASVVDNNSSSNTAQQSTSTTVPENIKSTHVSNDGKTINIGSGKTIVGSTIGSNNQNVNVVNNNDGFIKKMNLTRTKDGSTSSTMNISMMVLGGFIAAAGIAAIAIAFTVLNAATFGVAGLIVSVVGAAAALSGVGLFATGAYKNRQTTSYESLNFSGNFAHQ